MKVFRLTLVWALGTVASLASQAACVVNSSSDDGDSLTLTSTTSMTATSTAEGPGPDCVNVLQDPGFEQGAPNPYWDETTDGESTPICNSACALDGNAAPRSGAWWVWFGGFLEPTRARVAQTLVFAPTVSELRFFYQTFPGSATGDDSLTVRIDDTVVYNLTDGESESSSIYSEQVIDVSAFADGATHVVSFEGNTSGVGSPSIFVDDVSLYDCSGIGATTGTSTSSGTTGVESSTSAGSTGDDDTSTSGVADTGTESGGSSAGEESSSGEPSSSSTSGSAESSTGTAESSSSGASESSTGSAAEGSSGESGSGSSTGSETTGA